MKETFYMDNAEEIIRDVFNKHGVSMCFSHYHKFEFYWESEGNYNFKVNARYGWSHRGATSRVSSGEYREFKTFKDLKNAFTYIEIHDYTNQLLYTYED